jgi:hypothetical protein
MLMKDDKKKMATIIMGKMGKPQASPESEDGAEQDDSVALKTAGEELISALESKNPLAVASAIKALIELCESPEQESAEHEMEEEPQQP